MDKSLLSKLNYQLLLGSIIVTNISLLGLFTSTSSHLLYVYNEFILIFAPIALVAALISTAQGIRYQLEQKRLAYS